MELTFLHEIINPFFLKHNDQSWTDKIDQDSSVFTFTALKKYETSEEQFPFHFQKPEIFDKVEAVNIVGLLSFEYRTAEALPKEYKMK